MLPTPSAVVRGVSPTVTPPRRTFFYYLVDGNHLHLFSSIRHHRSRPSVAQTGTSLLGSYVFGSRGDDSFSLGGVNTVGQFTASNGSITAGGPFDLVQDGGTPVSGTFTGGTYCAYGGVGGPVYGKSHPLDWQRDPGNLLGGEPIAGLLHHR